jgi:hypothetical protein
MRKLKIMWLAALCFLAGSAAYAQILPDTAFRQKVTPCGITPGYLKSLGHTDGAPPPAGLTIPTAFPSYAIEHCGKFDIYYEDLISTNPQVGFSEVTGGLGAQRRATLCAVLTYVQSVFDFSNIPASAPIRFHVEQSYAPVANPAPTTVSWLAIAGPTFINTGTPHFINGFVYDYTVSGVDPGSSSQYHSEMTVNFDKVYPPSSAGIVIDWHSNHLTNVASCDYDLFSVLLHEVGHTLGWLSYTHYNGSGFPASTLGANQFSGLDNCLHKGTMIPFALNKLITGPPSSPVINPLFTSSTTALTSNDIWISPFAAPDNHPVYSGLECTAWPSSFAIGSILSHMDDQMWLYSRRARISPGDNMDYVMGPFGVKGIMRRTFTDVEINTLWSVIGYPLHPSYPTAGLMNLPPYSTRMANYTNVMNNDFPDAVAADFTMTNNIGSSLTINLNTDPTLLDPEGNPRIVAPGTLTNYRGCGDGTGNNHNALTVTGGGSIITYTPRPDFYGRAQFGFKVSDGSERGSYVIYTIDVAKGTNVSCTAGTNIVLNGDLEEGSEVKQLGPEETKDAAVQEHAFLREGKMRQGVHLSDSRPYNYMSNNWGPFGAGDMIRDSYLNCSGTTYMSIAGSVTTTFPFGGSAPTPLPTAGGERYSRIYSDYNYFNLCTDASNCRRYTLEFDYFAQPFFIPVGTNIPLTVGFTNSATFPAAATLNYSFVHTFTTASGWQHVSIPFTYCGTNPSSIMNLRQNAAWLGFFIDNVTLVENLSPPPALVVNITPSSPAICAGNSVTLTASGTNVLCNATYLWSPGGQTTASITVTPGSTTVYTCTINDGCRSASGSTTVTVNTPNITASASPSSVTAGSPSTLTTNATGAVWTPGGPGSSITVNPTVTTTYTVNGNDPVNGCPGTASVTVTVVPGACGSCPQSLETYAVGGVLSTSPTGHVVYCLNTNISISGTVSLVYDEIRIAPNVTITVLPGATLNILGSHLYSCTDMWTGIVVQPTGFLNVAPFTLFGTTVTPCIEDAKIAIDVISNSSVTSNPLTVNSALFNRNHRAINITGHTNASGPLTYPMTVVNSVFTCRNIAFTPGSIVWAQTGAVKATYAVPVMQTPYINDGTYPDNTIGSAYLKVPFLGQKSLSGITLRTVGATLNPSTTPSYYEMVIGSTTASQYNVFDNLGIGIDGADANFTSMNNIFQRTTLPQAGGYGIQAIAREKFNCRVQAIPASGTTMINQFFDCTRAINVINYFEVNARYCNVRSQQSFPTHYMTTHRGQHGFVLNTNRYIRLNLSDNTMYNIENGISFQANLGFYSVGPWTSGSGQYSGQVNIDRNIIQPHPTISSIVNEYVNRAITASNVIGSTHLISASNTVAINNNLLTNVYNGIRANNWQKKNLINNTNTIVISPVPGLGTIPQYGISQANNIPIGAMANRIEGNTVTGYGIANSNTVAISTSLCNNQVVKCNVTRNIHRGINFSGNEIPTNFSHNTFDNNTVSTHRHKEGYVLDNNGFIGQQGTATSPSNNKWTGTWTASSHFKTFTRGGSFGWVSGVGSPLYLRTTVSNENPLLSSGTGNNGTTGTIAVHDYTAAGAVNSASAPASIGCPMIVVGPHPPATITTMEKIAQDLIAYPVNAGPTKIIAKNQLYRALRADPSLVSGSAILQSFLSANETQAPGRFLLVEEELVDGDYAQAQAYLNTVTPASDIETGYKDFYNFCIKQQTDTLDDSDSIKLYQLSARCPIQYGAVTYQARAMYNALYDQVREFSDVCSQIRAPEEMNETEQMESGSISIYPNPAQGEVYLQAQELDDQLILVEIRDISGKLVYSQQLQLSGGLTTFNLDLNSGVYIVNITDSEKHETTVRKLVIQK